RYCDLVVEGVCTFANPMAEENVLHLTM
ncbi:MAG: hypothetical protein QG572_343, partial [Pseudomonadota bacterium]|nr:hypothetical protein [Pseudomonadota bacterium]